MQGPKAMDIKEFNFNHLNCSMSIILPNPSCLTMEYSPLQFCERIHRSVLVFTTNTHWFFNMNPTHLRYSRRSFRYFKRLSPKNSEKSAYTPELVTQYNSKRKWTYPYLVAWNLIYSLNYVFLYMSNILLFHANKKSFHKQGRRKRKVKFEPKVHNIVFIQNQSQYGPKNTVMIINGRWWK